MSRPPLLPHALLTFLLPLTSLAASSSSSLPKIDFSSLGSASVVGSFGGVSLYDPSSPAPSYDSSTSTLISRASDGSISKVGATDQGGSINVLCQAPSGQLFIGGNFTSIAGVAASHVASYSANTSTFASLGSGVDGPVLALACNGTSVYVGGNFTKPVGATGSYGGNVAVWDVSSSAWSAFPFSGLDGAVESIVETADGKSLFFGGSFSTLFLNSTVTNSTIISNSTTRTTLNASDIGNGTIYASLGSSLTPISLNGSDFWASPTTYTSGFGRPQYVFCPKAEDGPGSSWLLVDGQSGYFISRFYRPLSAKGIRLGNTFWRNRGTQNFSLTSIPDNTVLELSYASDPSDPTSALATCQENCVLAHNESIPYQDFIFPDSVSMTGFQLNIFGHYGAGAGLHLLQLLSDGAYDYAVADNNLSPCTSGLGASTQSEVSTNGNWTTTSVVSDIPGTTQSVLYGSVAGGTSVADAPTITWNPTITQEGVYTIVLVTPGCQQQDDCATRTSVSLTVTPGSASPSAASTTTVNQITESTLSSTIFSGMLYATGSSGGGVTVEMTLASGGAPNAGSTYYLVADYISLVAASTNGTISSNSTITTNSTLNSTSTSTSTGYGIFEFALGGGTGTFGDAIAASETLNATSQLQNATSIDQLAFRLPSGANVTSIVSADSQVFFGGKFVYTSATGNITSANVVSYSGTTKAVVVAPNGGLAGTVTSLVASGGVLYAAGAFVATTDGTVTGLAGSAQWAYNTTGSSWTAMGAGSSLGQSIVQLGVIDMGVNTSIVAVGGSGVGVEFYDPGTASWNTTEGGFFVGNLTAFGEGAAGNETATVYLAGNVVAASSTSAPGGASLSSSSGNPMLTSFGFSLEQQTATTSNASAAKRSLIAGPHPIRNSARSLVKEVMGSVWARAPSQAITTTLPSAISTDDTEGEVLTGAYWKNGSTTFMLLGGNFVSTNGVSNLGLYNTNTKQLSAVTGETIDGTVNTIAVNGDVAWIGGNFSTASGRQGLATYALNNMTSLDDNVPALAGYTAANATVNVMVQRPGYSNTVVFAGAFAAAGSLHCLSICSWDAKTQEWSAFSTGLQGAVGAINFAGSNSQYLLAAGDFLINSTTYYFAQWNYNNQTWSTLGAPTDIPGPATAVSADGTNVDKIFLAGTSSTNNSPYLIYWNGSTWADINNGTLEAGSGVQQLVFVPLSSDHSSNSMIETDRMLMVSGDLTLNSTSVSTALFDGTTWYPYLIASSSTGAGVISQFFYSVTDFTLSGKHLSVGIVILISIAIALGVVFLLVLIGLLIALARRQEESAYPVQPRQDADDVHVLHRPTSLLTAVGAATAVMLDSKGEKNQPLDHDSIAGPASVYGTSEAEPFEENARATARYSFQAEHVGELSLSAGEDLVILEASDENWYLVANAQGQRGLAPASYVR